MYVLVSPDGVIATEPFATRAAARKVKAILARPLKIRRAKLTIFGS